MTCSSSSIILYIRGRMLTMHFRNGDLVLVDGGGVGLFNFNRRDPYTDKMTGVGHLYFRHH